MRARMLSHVWLFAASWAIDHQAPLSMGFVRQEYWSGLPFPSLKDLPNPGIEPVSPALAGGFFTHWAIRKAHFKHIAEIFLRDKDRNKTLKSWFSYQKSTSGSFRAQSWSHSSYSGEEDTTVTVFISVRRSTHSTSSSEQEAPWPSDHINSSGHWAMRGPGRIDAWPV